MDNIILSNQPTIEQEQEIIKDMNLFSHTDEINQIIEETELMYEKFKIEQINNKRNNRFNIE